MYSTVPVFSAECALHALELLLCGVNGLVLHQRGGMRKHLQADCACVPGRRGVFPLPVLLEEGERGGHVGAQLTHEARRVGLVVGDESGHFSILEVAHGALVRLLLRQMLLLHTNRPCKNFRQQNRRQLQDLE